MRSGRALALFLAVIPAAASCTRSTLDLTIGGGPGGWWDAAWGYRAPIAVIAGPAVVPSGYSIALTFDHASLVAAGHAAPDGHDLRVVEDGAGASAELDRVLRDGSAWNASTTSIWFRSRAPIPPGGTLRLWLYYGNLASGPGPENRSNVFLFWDDFESGSLAKWNPLLNAGSYWTSSTTHSRSGANALRGGSTSSRKVILANGVDDRDVAFSAWWYATAATSLDFSQAVRAGQTTPLNLYKTNFYSASGWDVSKIITDTYTSISSSHGSLPPATWTQVTTLLAGSNMRVVVNGSQVSPPGGATSVGAELAHGTVGFQDANVPAGAGVWLDDVEARRYVDPEPTASVGAEEPHP